MTSKSKINTKAERKCEYPASQKAVERGSVANYMPTIDQYAKGWNVSLTVPFETYKKWAPRLAGNDNFRETVEERINDAFQGTLSDPWFIKILWDERGARSFRTFGNACDVSFDGNDTDLYEYVPHNIDTAQQALVLYTCLSIYARETMQYLDFFEKEPELFSKKPEIKNMIVTTITFDKNGNSKLLRK